MSHYYRHGSKREAEPRANSPKRRMVREIPSNPACFPGLDNSPSKMRAHKQSSTHDSDKSLLEMLSSTVACLKQKNMDLEALGCLEQSLWLKRRMFGVENSVVHKALNEVVLSYNSVAMQYLAQGQFDQCLAMLRKAEAITSPGNFKRCQALQILTFNNIGCCYRKLGKLKSALKYLKEAAQIGSGSAHVKNLSITHLNLCAIQSQLGRHDLALEHAQAAIFHTQEELVSLEDGLTDGRDEDGEQAALVDALNPKNREEKIISLAVAYHNLAVELEFNGRGEASLQWYKKALQLVWKYRDTNEALCESFKKIFLDAKKKQQTANVRQNGIPAAAFKASSSTNKRRPVTRPQSAHPLSRGGNEADRDVSYSSTVASQCYKSTKPSTAGQRYAPQRNVAVARNGKPQRPTSAVTRPRPVSAKSSARVNNDKTSRGSRDSAEDAFEQHWKKLEKENDLMEPQAPPKAERKARRPQSAGSSTAAARRQRTMLPRQQKLQGQVFLGGQEDDFIGDDKDYGVILDEGDSDDDFDKYPGSNREIDTGTATKLQSERLARKQRPGASGMQRHRRFLDDSRSQTFSNQSEASEDSESVALSTQDSQEGISLTGYSGDDDTDPDLPAQRVCHMEYLRRMKKLAESIKDDLHGAGICPPIVKPIELNPSKSPTYPREDDLTSNECSPNVSTPRSATSKLRDRIEQARHNSWESLPESKARDTKTNDKVKEDDGIELQEEAHVWGSEAEVCDAEYRMFQAAAGCRLQAFFRGNRTRAEVKQLKQAKLENDSANLIQRQVRRYVETVREERRYEDVRMQLELQKEEVEDMAACLIQRLCRRALGRKSARLVKSKNGDEGEKLSPAPQHRPFSIADVVLGAEVNKSQLNQGGRQYLSPAATVPHLNLGKLSEPSTPRRSSTVSSIPLGDSDGAQLPTKEPCEPTPRSDVYDDDVEWKSTSRDSARSPPRTEERKASQPRSVPATPRTNRCTREERQNDAATRIQAFMKGFGVRRRIAYDNASDLSRMYIEQNHFNVALDHALAMEQEFLEELCAIKIQALVRGQQSRLLTECIRAGVDTAASMIQRSFRSHRQRTQLSISEGVRSIAARTIQQVYRDYEARRAAIHQTAVDDERFSVQEIAASTIQNFWRQSFAARDHSLEEIEAATCIQALGRGYLTRSMKSLNGSSSGLLKHASGFSISSSAEKLVEHENSEGVRKTRSLSINYSFLPASIRELYLSSSGSQLQSTNSQIQAQEIAELGLSFEDFLRELETCTDVVVASSALDAMRVLVETSPESTQTLANVIKVARALDRRLHEGFWNEILEASSIALLHTFRDVLDAQ